MKIGFIFFCLTINICFGQSINDLSEKYKRAKQERLKMSYASDLAWKWRDMNPDSSVFYARVALRLSRKHHDKKIEAYSLADIANYYKRNENYNKAKKHLLESLYIRKNLDNKQDVASAYNQLGLLFRQQEKYDSAIVYFSKGIHLLSHEKTDIKASLLDGYGMSLFHKGNYNKAMKCLQQSMEIADYLQDSLSLARSHQNLGTIYEKQGAAELALIEFRDAEYLFRILGNRNGMLEMIIDQGSIYQQLNKSDLAKRAYLKAEQLSQTNGFIDNLPTIWFNLAELHLNTNPTLSINYYQRALENAASGEKKDFRKECLLGLMDAYLKTAQLEKAKMCKSKLEAIVHGSDRTIIEDFFDLCIRFSKQTGDFESAFKYSQNLIAIQDSVHEQAQNNLETLSLLEKSRNEQKITWEKLRRVKLAKQAQTKELQLIITIMVILMALLLIGIVVLFQIYTLRITRNKSALREQQIQNEMADLVHKSDLRVVEESLSVEEKTRKTIGKDLHDNLGNKLAVVQIMLESFQKKTVDSGKELQEKLQKAIQLVDDSCKDLRTISRNLVAAGLSDNSLINTINYLCDSVSENTHLNVVFQYEGEAGLTDIESRKNILATISLLIDNVLRHAQAKHAEVLLNQNNEGIFIAVRDDGIGFDITNFNLNEGIGLRNARERVAGMSGTIDFVSEKGKGTNVIIKLPVL